MRTRVFTTVLVGAMFLAAMWGAAAWAQSQDNDLDITEFRMDPVSTPHSYPPTQAGGNSNVSLFFRFCGPGLVVTNVVVDTATDPGTGQPLGQFVVTVATVHDVERGSPFSYVKMRGVRSLPGVNGLWTARRIDDFSFRLVTRTQPPAG